MPNKPNCERRVSEVWKSKRNNLRMHQTNMGSSPSHGDIWWYGISFDDGYLYMPEKTNRAASFSIMDKNSEIDLD